MLISCFYTNNMGSGTQDYPDIDDNEEIKMMIEACDAMMEDK